MIIKKIGTKIVNIGATVLMPDTEAKFSKEIASAPSIKALEELGFIKMEDDTERVRTRASRRVVEATAQEKDAASSAKAETNSSETSQSAQENK